MSPLAPHRHIMDTGAKGRTIIRMLYPCGIEPCRTLSSSYDEMVQHIHNEHLALISVETVGERKFLKLCPGVWRDTSVRIRPAPAQSQEGNSTSVTSTTDPSIEIPSFGSLPPPPLLGSQSAGQTPTVLPTHVIFGSHAVSQHALEQSQDFLRSPTPNAGPSHSTPLDVRHVPPTQSQDVGAPPWPPSSPFIPVTQAPPVTQIQTPSAQSSSPKTSVSRSSHRQTESREPTSVSYHSESSKQHAQPQPKVPSALPKHGPNSGTLGFGSALNIGLNAPAASKRKESGQKRSYGELAADGSPEHGRSGSQHHPLPAPSIGRGGVSFDWASK